jgi:endonuclease YncB( thermonuclease family)
MKNNKINNKPQDWQTDSRNVKTAYVQFWSTGSMVNGQMDLDVARTMVDEGQAFVINEQSIGLLYNGRMES